jgi:hypothetical protein
LVEVVHPDLSVDEDSIFAGRNFILSIRNRNSLSLRVPQSAIFWHEGLLLHISTGTSTW